MRIPVKLELVRTCKEIVAKNFTLNQWAEIESDDLFQSPNFEGGFDADESEFCFSYFAPDKTEYWFQFTLETATKIATGSVPN